MAIFQKAYQGYNGELTSLTHRPWVIFRYALADAFSTRYFLAYFIASLMPAVIAVGVIYLRYNLEVLLAYEIPMEALVSIDSTFFAQWVQRPQLIFTFFLITFVGPAAISPDLRNNGLPLYLSRPISKTGYILGKLAVLVALCSVISWVPGLLLVALQGYLAGGSWMVQHSHLPIAMVLSSLIWIISLSLMALAVSACVKWTPIARMVFFGIILVGSMLGSLVHGVLGGEGAVGVFDSQEAIVHSLYQTRISSIHNVSVETALSVFASISIVSAIVLSRKIRASEVVA